MDSLLDLLDEDVRQSMPPYELWLRGPEELCKWYLGPGIGCKGSRLVPTSANGLPAFGQYKPSGPGGALEPWSLVVVEISGGQITGLDFFLDTASLFPLFGCRRRPSPRPRAGRRRPVWREGARSGGRSEERGDHRLGVLGRPCLEPGRLRREPDGEVEELAACPLGGGQPSDLGGDVVVGRKPQADAAVDRLSLDGSRQDSLPLVDLSRRATHLQRTGDGRVHVHGHERTGGTGPRRYGWRPMNARSLVCSSASAGTATRGP